MKTMNFQSSRITQVVCGMALGLIAIGLAALTHTGIIGIYGFGCIGLVAIGTFFMWPERNRFFVDKSHSTYGDKRRSQTTHSSN